MAGVCWASVPPSAVRPGLASHYLLLAPLLPSVWSLPKVSVPAELLTELAHLRAVAQKATESLLLEGSPARQQKTRPDGQEPRRALSVRANRCI